jgi:ATP-dependent DNA helicase RecQ
LTKQVDVAEKAARSRIGAIACDELLFEQLRGLRRRLADERDVPAYVIFSDVTLREMARNYPTTPTEFRRIPGVGEQKLKDFAEPFLSEIRAYLTTNERRTFTENGGGPLRPPRRARLNDSQLETLRRFQRGEAVEDIARARGFVRSTIYSHLLTAIECGKLVERERFFTPAQEEEIAAAFRRVRDGSLTDIAATLGNRYDIGLLRIFRALAAHSRAQSQR